MVDTQGASTKLNLGEKHVPRNVRHGKAIAILDLVDKEYACAATFNGDCAYNGAGMNARILGSED